MEWTECSIETTSYAVDSVGEMLYQAGISGFIIEDNEEMKRFLKDNPGNWDYIDDALQSAPPDLPRVKFYVPQNKEGRDVLSRVQDALRALSEMDLGFDKGALLLSVSQSGIDETVWLEKWKEYYKPFKIGRRIIVRPVWEQYRKTSADADDLIVFTINPGNVFGTGLHQSTQLCIKALENSVKPGQTVLDIGGGSGILSIIAMLLGASCATLTDIDPAAADTAYENARLNGIGKENFKALTGNILTDESLLTGKYDIITANITADIVISLAPVCARVISGGGVFITSGIIDTRRDDVVSALENAGFKITGIENAEGWVGMVCVFS